MITHGLNPGSGNNQTWMSAMAAAIKDRCTAEGRVVPQIALYFWDSNPMVLR